MGEALVHPVGDGPVIEQGGEHLPDTVEHLVDAANVEKGFLLPGEGGFRQVLGSGRGPYRNAAAEGVIGFTDGTLQTRRKGMVHDHAAYGGAGLPEIRQVVDIEGIEDRADVPVEVLVPDEGAVGIRRGGEPVGDPDARR